MKKMTQTYSSKFPGFIETDYRYQEDWQWQRIYINPNTLEIIRDQNFMTPDGIQEQDDHFLKEDKGWGFLFEKYGRKVIEGNTTPVGFKATYE